MCHKHGGHISTSYSCVEMLVALYYGGLLRFDPAQPKWPERDRFILSKGHGETILYAVLADLGFFPADWLDTSYRAGACVLGGHIDSKVPGIEVTTGALGHGLGLGCGMALAAQMDQRDTLHYVMLGDAECSEGSVWEAALFAAQHKLANLVAIVDFNKIGSLDYTKNYIALDPMADKWRAFGWNVTEIDGHDYDQIHKALLADRTERTGAPRAVIAHTTKGKGVSVFENDPAWHVKPVGDEHVAIALKELAPETV
jgi:transketolase